MPNEEPATDDIPAQETATETQHTAIQAPNARAYEPGEAQEDWYEEPIEQEELPRRPRRRLLTPVPLALFAVLLIACGFIGGVLVEKGEGSSLGGSSASGGLASRFAALRTGSAGATASGGRAGGTSSSAGTFGAGAAGGARATIGQVAYLSGHTLYVTTSEGNTVKVTTSDESTVTKTVKADVKGIHPGETVIVTGSTGANGAVSAESIRVSEAGADGGLGAALFGGAGRGGGGSGRRSGGGGGGEPALFGG
jgi:hypothetical protein